MKTLAVMCMALQRTNPSWTPLLRTISSTWRVMLMKSIRAGTLKVRYSVCDFMVSEGLLQVPKPTAPEFPGESVGDFARRRERKIPLRGWIVSVYLARLDEVDPAVELELALLQRRRDRREGAKVLEL